MCTWWRGSGRVLNPEERSTTRRTAPIHGSEQEKKLLPSTLIWPKEHKSSSMNTINVFQTVKRQDPSVLNCTQTDTEDDHPMTCEAPQRNLQRTCRRLVVICIRRWMCSLYHCFITTQLWRKHLRKYLFFPLTLSLFIHRSVRLLFSSMDDVSLTSVWRRLWRFLVFRLGKYYSLKGWMT